MRTQRAPVERDRPGGEEEGEQCAGEVDERDDLDVPTSPGRAAESPTRRRPASDADGSTTSTSARLSLSACRQGRASGTDQLAAPSRRATPLTGTPRRAVMFRFASSGLGSPG